MESRRFDALTRAMAEGASRRSVIKGLFGGVFGGAAAVAALDNAAAQQCGTNEFACGAGCCDVSLNCCGGTTCCPGNRCNTAGVCCDESDFSCGATCCDTQTQKCCGGVCIPADACCPLFEEDCGPCEVCQGGICVDQCEDCEDCATDGVTCVFRCGACDTCVGNECVDTGFACGSSGTGCCLNAEACCDDGCCAGVCGADGLCCDTLYCEAAAECCADPSTEKCCGTAGCCAGECYSSGTSCCESATSFVCAVTDQCCLNAETCCSVDGCCDGSCNSNGGCCDADYSFVCGADCCDNDDEKCCGGECISASLCCPDYAEDCPLECEICVNGQCVENCPDCESCNAQGVCETDCEPGDACTTYTCVNGACMYDGCEINETCCENGAAHCADLLFNHENCGACGYGCDGCEICFNGQCVETDACCQTYGEPCEPYGDDDDDDDDDWGSNCCEGLVCCHVDESQVRPSGGATMYCAQCCDDSHCGNGKCCNGSCINSQACCSDADCGECEECLYMNGYGYDACVQMGSLFGEYCHQEGDDDDDDYSYSDCCDGLVCCGVDHDGNRCFECCDDWDCPKGTECREGVCQAECSHDKDCPDGTCCCKSGHCSKHCCGHAHTDGGTYVDTLPSTGSGDTAANAGWMGAAALGAAAYFAGKTLRDAKSAEPEAETNE